MIAPATLRKIAKYAGYPAFFLLAFWISLVLTFPVERFAPLLEQQAGELLGREVSIGDISISPLGGLVFSSVEIGVPEDEDGADGRAGRGRVREAEEPGEEEPPADAGAGEGQGGGKKARPAYFIDEMDVDIGLVSLLFGGLDLGAEFDGLGGEISFAYSGPMPGGEPERPARVARGRAARGARNLAAGQAGALGALPPGAEAAAEEPEEDGDVGSEGELLLTIEAHGIELAQIRDLRSKLPLPISGTLDLEARLASESGSFADAEGEISFRLAGVAIGAEKAEIDVGGMPMTVDPIAVESIDCRAPVKAGVAGFEAFETKSGDFDLKLSGTITLGDQLKRSRFDLYLMFRFLDGYLAKSEKAKMLVSNVDQFSRDFKLAHRDDGYWGFRYRGVAGHSRFLPSKLGPGEQGAKASKRASDRRRGARAKRGAAAENLPTGPAGGFEPPMREEPEEPLPQPKPEPEPIRELDDHGRGAPGAAEAEPAEEEPAAEEPAAEEAQPEEVQPEEAPAEEPAAEEPAAEEPAAPEEGAGGDESGGEQVE